MTNAYDLPALLHKMQLPELIEPLRTNTESTVVTQRATYAIYKSAAVLAVVELGGTLYLQIGDRSLLRFPRQSILGASCGVPRSPSRPDIAWERVIPEHTP